MLSSLTLTALRAAPMVTRAPVVQAAAARYATQVGRRFMSEKPFAVGYAVDGPDGDHDFQDLVRFKNMECRMLQCRTNVTYTPHHDQPPVLH